MTITWGEWVRDQMQRRRWEQADAARAAGLPRSAISQWLAGGQRPTVENIRKFARAVEVPVVIALVHAGYLTHDEADLTEHDSTYTLSEVSDTDLLAEIAARFNRASPERHTPELPDVEVAWPRSATPSSRRQRDSPEQGTSDSR